MNQHLNDCIKKSHGKLYMLSKIRCFMNKKTALNLFKCMVLPYIEYGNCLLLGSDLASLCKLQRAQNEGLKVALGHEQRYSTSALHKEARLASWEVQARLALMRLMFKYEYCDEFLLNTNDGSTTRSHDGPLFLLDRLSTGRFHRSCPLLAEKTGTAYLLISGV